MRSGSPKPTGAAMRSMGSALASIRARAASTPQPLDGAGRRDAGLGGEGAGEIARAHRRLLGEALDAERLAQPLARPAEQRREPALGPLQLEQGRELRLAARRGGDRPQAAGRSRRARPRRGLRRSCASARSMPAVMPAEVQTGAVAHIDAVRLQPHLRIARAKSSAAAANGWWRAARRAARPRRGGRRPSRRWRRAARRPRARTQDKRAVRRLDARPARAVAAGDEQRVERGAVGEASAAMHRRAGGAATAPRARRRPRSA